MDLNLPIDNASEESGELSPRVKSFFARLAGNPSMTGTDGDGQGIGRRIVNASSGAAPQASSNSTTRASAEPAIQQPPANRPGIQGVPAVSRAARTLMDRTSSGGGEGAGSGGDSGVVDTSALFNIPSVLGKPPALPIGVVPGMGQSSATAATRSNPYDKVAPPPKVPDVDPDYLKTEQDLRGKMSVTPKTGPDGQTLPQYREGTGGRIGRAFMDAAMGLARGGARGAVSSTLQGAFGNPNSPGYYGKGAVNRQWSVDEAQRQKAVQADQDKIASYGRENSEKQRDFADRLNLFRDDTRNAADQAISQTRQEAEAEKERHNQETEDLRRTLQEATTPEAKADAEQRIREKIAKELKLTGDDYKFYKANGKLPDDRYKARELSLREAEFGLRKEEFARKQDVDLNGLTASEQREYAAKTRTNTAKIQSVIQSRKDRLTMRRDTADLDKQLDDLNQANQQVYDGIVGARKGRGTGTQAKAGTPQQPAAASNQPPKSISRAKVQEFVDQNNADPKNKKVTYQDVERQFKGKNYRITQ